MSDKKEFLTAVESVHGYPSMPASVHEMNTVLVFYSTVLDIYQVDLEVKFSETLPDAPWTAGNVAGLYSQLPTGSTNKQSIVIKIC